MSTASQVFNTATRVGIIFLTNLASYRPTPLYLANHSKHRLSCFQMFVSASIELKNIWLCPWLSHLTIWFFASVFWDKVQCTCQDESEKDIWKSQVSMAFTCKLKRFLGLSVSWFLTCYALLGFKDSSRFHYRKNANALGEANCLGPKKLIISVWCPCWLCNILITRLPKFPNSKMSFRVL